MLGARDHTVSRFAPDTDVEGRAVPGAESTLTVRGSLQPLSAREQRQLADGKHARAEWLFLTRVELNQTDGAQRADQLHHKGKRLEVIGVEDFSDDSFGLAHFEYLLAEVEVPE